MKLPRQTKKACDPDFDSFKFWVRSRDRSKILMKRLMAKTLNVTKHPIYTKNFTQLIVKITETTI